MDTKTKGPAEEYRARLEANYGLEKAGRRPQPLAHLPATRVTPTGWAEQKGTAVRQLGSREAVLDAIPVDAAVVIIVADHGEAQACLNAANGKGRTDLVEATYYTAFRGPMELWAVAPETLVAVMPGALDRVGREVWGDYRRVLTSRFKEVIWG